MWRWTSEKQFRRRTNLTGCQWCDVINSSPSLWYDILITIFVTIIFITTYYLLLYLLQLYYSKFDSGYSYLISTSITFTYRNYILCSLLRICRVCQKAFRLISKTKHYFDSFINISTSKGYEADKTFCHRKVKSNCISRVFYHHAVT